MSPRDAPSGGDTGDRHRRALARGVGLFDAGEFWLAHEQLELLWLRDRSPLLKACILLAAACLHAGRGNAHGATVKAEAALRCLRRAGEREHGFKVAALSRRVDRLLAEWRAGRLDARMRLGPFAPIASTPPVSGTAALPYRVRRYEQGYRPGRDPRRRD